MKILGGAALAGLSFWVGSSYYQLKTTEKPDYEVFEKRWGYEIRKYNDYIIAQVEVEGKRRQALNTGFKILANYIFGGNTKKEQIEMTAPVNDIQKQSEQIAMTAPVNAIEAGKGKHIVQFILPKKYTLISLPEPDDNSIQIKEVSGYKAAALQYTFWATDKSIAKKTQKLTNLLEKDNEIIVGEAISAQYNAPYTFPLVRRNEIIIPIQ